MTRARGLIVIAAVLGAALALPAAGAPPSPPPQPNGPPNALQGFSQNRGQPVKIDAASLEVRDKDKLATFSGSVKLVQGDTTLRCKTLVVFYDQGATPNAPKTQSVGPTGSQQIRRMEAKGGVVVTQKDQTATGDSGVYDLPSNTVTLIGSVTVTQGQNIMQSERLVVDLTTGVSHLEGRVKGLIIPTNAPRGDANKSDSKTAPETKTPGEAPRQRPLHPSGIY